MNLAISNLSDTEQDLLRRGNDDLEFVLLYMLDEPTVSAVALADRPIIERELKSEVSLRYWKSKKFAKRWQELQGRLDNGTTTVEEAARFLRVPLAVFRWFYAHRKRMRQLGLA